MEKRGLNLPWLYRDPASEIELDHVERILDFKIPDSLRVIYRLHDGQLPDTEHYGLFGG